MSSALALRAIAYDLQVKAHGGLKRHELQALLRAAATDQGISAIQKDKRISNVPPTFLPDGNDFRASPKPKQKKHCLRSKPKPGTRLIRNWQGEAQVVDVFQEGYGWRGKIFRSLTVIAKEITGTHQSGPRFFRT